MTSTALLQELGQDLADRRVELERLDGYFREGYVDALDAPGNARPELRKIIRAGVTNWLKLTVETTAERLIVDGFRRREDDSTDSTLWEWWQRNRLDGRQMAHYVELLKAGESYVSVWPGEEDAPPVIRCESSWSVRLMYGDDPFVPVAGMKLGRGGKAWLYLPDSVETWSYSKTLSKWQKEDEVENPLGEVPFVHFRVNPTVDGGFASDLDVAIPIQDRITRTTIERIIAAYFSAYRQRYATGLVLDVDDAGEPIAPFNLAADRMLIADDPDVKFGEFSEATLSNYIAAVEADVQHLAAVTRTPPHYLLGKMVNLSAEALTAAETGLARKVWERQQTIGESWEDVMRLAAVAADEPEIASDYAVETVWRKTESVSEAQRVDAATKLVSLDVPTEILWERIGASPQEITRWRRMATNDALLAAVRNPGSAGGAAEPDAPEEPETATEEA